MLTTNMKRLTVAACGACLLLAAAACSSGGASVPAVRDVRVTGSGAALNVTAVVMGSATTCTVAVKGGASATGACGRPIAVSVPMYHSLYTVTYTAAGSAGTASAIATGLSGLKPLTADAIVAYGSCPNEYNGSAFCGGDSNLQPSAAFSDPRGPLVTQGSTVMASCWTTGGADTGEDAAYPPNVKYYDWVRIASSPAGTGYMGQLWFTNPGTATSNLPRC